MQAFSGAEIGPKMFVAQGFCQATVSVFQRFWVWWFWSQNVLEMKFRAVCCFAKRMPCHLFLFSLFTATPVQDLLLAILLGYREKM